MPITQPLAPSAPRIYYLDPQRISPAAELERHLDRCVAMGFDHALTPMQASGEATRGFAAMCSQKGLRWLMDLDLHTQPSLEAQHPDWFAESGEEDDLPDPRRLVTARKTSSRRAPRYDRPETVEAMLAYWKQSLQEWIAEGVSGFRCLDVAEPPPWFWQKLCATIKAEQKGIRFLAWTPGCMPQQIKALAGCGFDATFSSGAWWDYKSPWLADEQERLYRVAPPIVFPDSPDDSVIARLTGNEELATRRRIHLRALGLAAVSGNGLLMPMGFEWGMSGAAISDGQASQDKPFDLSDEIARLNAFIAAQGAQFAARPFRLLSSPGASVAVLLRTSATNANEAALLIANADLLHARTIDGTRMLERADGYTHADCIWPQRDNDTARNEDEALALAAADVQLFTARRLAPILSPPGRGKQAATAAARVPRIAIEAISPSIDGGRFPVKRTVGEVVTIEADVFADGHDKLAVALLWRTADETAWHEVRMHPTANDRWAVSLPLARVGRYLFTVEAWRDVFATYRDELEKKTTAGLNVSLELEEGRLLVEAAVQHAQEQELTDTAAALKALAKSLKSPSGRGKDKAEQAAAKDAERIAVLLSEPMAEAMRLADARPFAVRSEPVLRIESERRAARFSSWYELFPRSQSGDPARHGTFADVEKRLPAIQAMGFDTLYFTPIHPIGRKHRKGRNNSLTPAPDDPGSPYAIGSEEGGHDAIHPQLGTLQDFRHLRDAAAAHGLELALDFAIQCSPDHPWLKEHPDWFAWRPDGTIRYAENPPKKYQDIVNVDFYAEGAVPSLWIALRDVVQFWVKEGVRVFRVDNPHTKPLPFWEWMIADIRGRHPDTIFLSEAFTRPKMMYRLAKAGFSQSYTYFTWRHTKQEFIDYMTELTTTPVREHFRPHFFVNTPDINPVFLQKSGRPGFLIRAALATTLSGLWGMYSGFELCDATPVPGKEEYLDSEKYEIRAWDWQRPGNIIAEITQLNRIRKQNPALQTHLNVRFLKASNDNILFFVKSSVPADGGARFGDNTVLVAINLDPFAAHEATLELPLWEFGLPDDGVLEVEDLINGTHLSWRGTSQPLRLDPFTSPYAIWRVRSK